MIKKTMIGLLFTFLITQYTHAQNETIRQLDRYKYSKVEVLNRNNVVIKKYDGQGIILLTETDLNRQISLTIGKEYALSLIYEIAEVVGKKVICKGEIQSANGKSGTGYFVFNMGSELPTSVIYHVDGTNTTMVYKNLEEY